MTARPQFLNRIDTQVSWGRPGYSEIPAPPDRMPDGSYLAAMDLDDEAGDDVIEIGPSELLLYAVGLVILGGLSVMVFQG